MPNGQNGKPPEKVHLHTHHTLTVELVDTPNPLTIRVTGDGTIFVNAFDKDDREYGGQTHIGTILAENNENFKPSVITSE